MMNCKEASRLTSDSMERKLTLWQRVSLWFHFGMCKLCSGFSKDLQRLREAVHRHAEQIENDTASSDAAQSQEARERMKRALESQDS